MLTSLYISFEYETSWEKHAQEIKKVIYAHKIRLQLNFSIINSLVNTSLMTNNTKTAHSVFSQQMEIQVQLTH